MPVVGVIPRESINFFPERHLGLVPHQESDGVEDAMQHAASRMKECVDLETLRSIAGRAGSLGCPVPGETSIGTSREAPRVTIGVLRDSAFQF